MNREFRLSILVAGVLNSFSELVVLELVESGETALLGELESNGIGKPGKPVVKVCYKLLLCLNKETVSADQIRIEPAIKYFMFLLYKVGMKQRQYLVGFDIVLPLKDMPMGEV